MNQENPRAPQKYPPSPKMQFRHLITRPLCSSSAVDLHKLKGLQQLPAKHRPRAIKDAQKVLTEYLHATRTLPFHYAEHISKNSFFFLSDLIAKVDYTPAKFSGAFQRFLSYHPVNEFEFFYESIGIDHTQVNTHLPVKKYFIAEDSRVFDVACKLSCFGFPWKRIGLLYEQEISIFKQDPLEIDQKLEEFKRLGFTSVSVIGICLAFPFVLGRKGFRSNEIDALIDDLRIGLLEFTHLNSVEGNVDGWYDICRKIRLFYDLGCRKGQIGALLPNCKAIFVDDSEEVLAQKIEFFTSFSGHKEDVGMFLLSRPEFLKPDIQNSGFISVLGFLRQFGLSSNELKSVAKNYPHVLGRNKLLYLPGIMKSLNLNERFFREMEKGDHNLLTACTMENSNGDLDKDYQEGLVKIASLRTQSHEEAKLNFLHYVGFGENKITIRTLFLIHGTSTELDERFNILLDKGIQFSKLCKMISRSPKMLNQEPASLEEKINYLCGEIGSSVKYLDLFPAYLCYDLNNRIKPRFRFYMWLKQNGLCKKDYSVASMVATSEKAFISRVYTMHPAAPKIWFEFFFNREML